MGRLKNPQLALRLDAAAPGIDWREGAQVPYLGGMLRLRLSAEVHQATLAGDDLLLPLPPEAAPRQIRDGAESWLRGRAAQIIGQAAQDHAARLGRPAPELRLSFSLRGGWAETDGDALRCQWRLVEQSPQVIDTVIARAVAALPPRHQTLDLFAA